MHTGLGVLGTASKRGRPGKGREGQRERGGEKAGDSGPY